MLVGDAGAGVARRRFAAMPGLVATGVPLVLCAKGIEHDSGLLLSEIAETLLPANPVACAVGPELCRRRGARPADGGGYRGPRRGARRPARAALLDRTFRCYSTDDLVGVEIGGALKNVFALAAGAVAGAGLGASAQAAMVTRGFVELRRMGAGIRGATRKR